MIHPHRDIRLVVLGLFLSMVILDLKDGNAGWLVFDAIFVGIYFLALHPIKVFQE